VETVKFEIQGDLVLQLHYASGDAAIKGWDQDQVQVTIDGSPDQCTVEEHEGTLTIDAHAPISVRVPRRATVQTGQVSGDLLLRDLDGTVSVDTVHGDLSLKSGSGPVSIVEVHGDVAAEGLGGPFSLNQAHADVRLIGVSAAKLGQIHGSVRVRGAGQVELGSVSGDVRATDVAGPISLEVGRGDFRGKALRGGMRVHEIKGDLHIKTALTPGQSYSGRAAGDVVARFPPDASAHLELEAGGVLRTNLPDIEWVDDHRAVGQVGDGGASVSLYAGRDLSVKMQQSDEPGDLASLARELSAQIEAEVYGHIGQMDAAAGVRREIDQALRKAERELRKAQRGVERKAARHQERARRIQERAERAARRAQTRLRRTAHRWGTSGPTRSSVSRERAQPASKEEQLAILRMLQEKKITPEQAEMLFDALEGR